MTAKKDGKYHLVVNFTAKGNFAGSGFDFNKAALALKLDGQELFHNEYAWAERREYREEFDVNWTAGKHKFQFDLTPLTPGVKQTTQLEIRVDDVIVRGPVDRSQWVRPANYARYFPPQNTPEDAAGRKAAAKTLLRAFATRAFRRPADEPSVFCGGK